MSGVTVSFSALLACLQTDIKRLIAFSTISQVAYLYVGVCVFNSTAAIFYLWLHAINKAVLFIICGYVIHICGGLTTLRKCGGVYRFILFFFSFCLIIFVNLAGMPGFVGFFFKELFLSQCLASQPLLVFVVSSFCLSFGLTGFYLYKLFYFTLFSYPKSHGTSYQLSAACKHLLSAGVSYLYARGSFTLNSVLKYFYF
jgi:NADH-quinone oxidoreductase subunit L